MSEGCWKRFAASVWPIVSTCVIVVYFSFHAWFLARNLTGDVSWSVTGYFFTWDMFPGYACESTHRILIGETESGRFVQLVPGPEDQYRDRRGGATRADLNHSEDHLPQIAAAAVDRVKLPAEDNGLKRVYWIRRYSSLPYLLPDDLYQSWTGQEKPPSGVFYEIRATADVRPTAR